ncbi:MAG TPA: TrkH family potassium uptake protein [Desulfonatronum sp.]|nr:TrkH family potassium uptake protein [Desulfonatronum sp.]
MHWRAMLSFTGAIIAAVGLFMFPALLCSLYYKDTGSMPLLISMVCSTFLGSFLYLGWRKHAPETVTSREAMAIVALCWISAGLFGAMPFYLNEAFDSFTDALFESISGFTTTGSSVLVDIEAVAPGLLFWRSMTQWLGGMGIIVLSVAVLPILGVGGMHLYRAEFSGGRQDRIKPRVRAAALSLWKVYILFTVLLAILLLLGGMNLFDALCHTLSTVATGGYSTKNLSMGHFQSAYLSIVVTVFMFLGAVNFALHYQALRGDPLALWRNSEARFFLILVLAAILIIALTLWATQTYVSFLDALLAGAFNLVSIITTTGFATTDFETWPSLTKGVLLLAMFVGGCAGSTAGGVKCMRIQLMCKHIFSECFRVIHPHAVVQVKMSGKVVEENVLAEVCGFLGLFAVLYVAASLLLAAMGLDMVTAFSASIAAMGNIGPGFGSVGPAENFAHLPAAAKWLLSWCMLLGRLELYALIIFLIPEFWKK